MKLNRMFRFVFIALVFAGVISSECVAQSKTHKKKAAAAESVVAVTPIYVYAQDPVFKAFVGLDLPNQLHVTGSVAKTSDFQASYTTGVNIVKLDGPGAIGGMDSVWYWRYKPFAIDTGKTYTVRFLAGATRHGGSADTMIGSFTVKVYPLVPEDPALYSTRDEHKYPTAYTNVPFKINGRYKDLDGDYKIEVRICDKEKVCELRTFYGPYAEYTSRSPENEGKDIEINIYFRSYQSSVWLPMRTDHATVAAAPFAVVMLDKINPLKDQSIRAYYGVEGYFTPVSANYLEVESAGFFETKALKIPKASGDSDPSYEFMLRPTEKAPHLTDKETPVQVTFKDPVTGKQFTKSVIVVSQGEASK